MSRETGDNQDRNHSDNMPMASIMDVYLSRRSPRLQGHRLRSTATREQSCGVSY